MISATPELNSIYSVQSAKIAPCEIITAEQFAERWHVSVRWIMDRRIINKIVRNDAEAAA